MCSPLQNHAKSKPRRIFCRRFKLALYFRHFSTKETIMSLATDFLQTQYFY